MAHHDPWLDHLKSVLHEGILWKQQPKLGKTFSKIDPLSFQQTHEQFGISQIPDILRIKYNFDGQAVEDPRTVSQNPLNPTSVYPMRLHLSTLNGKRTNFYTYLATAQRTKYAVVPVHTDSVHKSSSVRFFAPKMGNREPQPVYD